MKFSPELVHGIRFHFRRGGKLELTSGVIERSLTSTLKKTHENCAIYEESMTFSPVLLHSTNFRCGGKLELTCEVIGGH